LNLNADFQAMKSMAVEISFASFVYPFFLEPLVVSTAGMETTTTSTSIDFPFPKLVPALASISSLTTLFLTMTNPQFLKLVGTAVMHPKSPGTTASFGGALFAPGLQNVHTADHTTTENHYRSIILTLATQSPSLAPSSLLLVEALLVRKVELEGKSEIVKALLSVVEGFNGTGVLSLVEGEEALRGVAVEACELALNRQWGKVVELLSVVEEGEGEYLNRALRGSCVHQPGTPQLARFVRSPLALVD